MGSRLAAPVPISCHVVPVRPGLCRTDLGQKSRKVPRGHRELGLVLDLESLCSQDRPRGGDAPERHLWKLPACSPTAPWLWSAGPARCCRPGRAEGGLGSWETRGSAAGDCWSLGTSDGSHPVPTPCWVAMRSRGEQGGSEPSWSHTQKFTVVVASAQSHCVSCL